MNGSDARDLAKRKARYGHKDWIVWWDKQGNFYTDKATSASVKQALLTVGTQGYFYMFAASTATAYNYGWRIGTMYWKNLRYFESHREE